MLRNILALLAGLIVGMAFNMALVLLNTYVLFPMPEGLDMTDTQGFNEYIGGLPLAAFIIVLVAHLGQAFTGAWVAARLAASKPMLWAVTIGLLSLIFGIMNMMQVTHPTWMYIELPLYLLVAWWGGKLAARKGS